MIYKWIKNSRTWNFGVVVESNFPLGGQLVVFEKLLKGFMSHAWYWSHSSPTGSVLKLEPPHKNMGTSPWLEDESDIHLKLFWQKK